MKSVTTYTKTA